jgi:hypothetical protein
MSTATKRRLGTSWWSVVVFAAFTTACVGSELDVPANHPGHAAARTGKMPKTTTLGPLPAAAPAAAPAKAQPNPHSGAKH